MAREELAQRPWTMIQLLITEPDSTGHKRLVIRDAKQATVRIRGWSCTRSRWPP